MDFIKTLIAAAVGGLVAGGLLITFAPAPEAAVTAGSPAGTTFSNAKTAMINFAPVSGAASTTALYNGDASDRIIKQATYSCAGVTSVGMPLASGGWSLRMATSSVGASGGLGSNTNYVLNTTQATSTAEVFMSSTTPGLTGTAAFRRWAAGSYLIIASNASSTATCNIGVDYLAT